jgi:ABC-type sugar transport system ATPase subunit
VEIAKALGRDARVIVMDEPTSALTSVEVERLFGLIEDLKARGCAVVYITHKMEEIYRIADRISVLRDGRLVGSDLVANLPREKLIALMVGRDFEEQFPRRAPTPGAVRLKTGGPVGLEVRAGEIFGLAGLQGSGNSELLLSLFCGNYPGAVELDGTPVSWRSPREAVSRGVALLTNDRKATGLVLSMSVVANSVMAGKSPTWRNPKAEEAEARAIGDTMRLRAASLHMDVGELSGGNQQKVALAKWIRTRPRVFLLDEPTRGVDVGAKHEIYQLMERWSEEGMAIILISTELPELLALSDRVGVMRRGKLAAILSREEATPERVLEEAM